MRKPIGFAGATVPLHDLSRGLGGASRDAIGGAVSDVSWQNPLTGSPGTGRISLTCPRNCTTSETRTSARIWFTFSSNLGLHQLPTLLLAAPDPRLSKPTDSATYTLMFKTKSFRCPRFFRPSVATVGSPPFLERPSPAQGGAPAQEPLEWLPQSRASPEKWPYGLYGAIYFGVKAPCGSGGARRASAEGLFVH